MSIQISAFVFYEIGFYIYKKNTQLNRILLSAVCVGAKQNFGVYETLLRVSLFPLPAPSAPFFCQEQSAQNRRGCITCFSAS